jgi:signal transduction histidine kinase/ActR/RegA family two-component response regulator
VAFYEGIALDITDRKQAEEALLESEAKYRNMMESFADPLYICSPEFTVNYMNPAMIRRIGRDATGEKCHFAIHGLDSKCDWCIFDKINSGEIETKIKSPLDGKDFLVSNVPFQNQDGTISKMAILRDITDYLQAVSEKEEVQAQLIQSQKMESIGNLAGGIAHDFNNILSSIIGFTELALDDAIQGSVQEDNLREVCTAGNRARDLVRQILVFARQSEKEKEPVQVDLIVKEAMKLIKSTTPATIKISQNLDSKSLILANATQIHQVVMNLCTNAVDAMNDGGLLSVELRDEQLGEPFTTGYPDLNPGEYIALTVSDTGCGIAADLVESIYEPYFTTKKFGEGTGLGLSTVYGIVKQCSGEIFIETEPNRGSKFKVYMPITKSRKKLTSYRHGKLPTGKERILLVDNEVMITKMTQQTLSRLGYNVTTRTSPVEALEFFKVRSNDIDLVITDMTMPNITGDKLSIELMKIRPDIPIILCSGFSKNISDELASKIGIRAFVYKPIVKEELAKMIRQVLDQSKSLS